MKSNVFENKRKQILGQAKVRWEKLTDDDLKKVEGKFDKLIGLLQVKHGYTLGQAEAEYEKRMK
jgi:uncharacterized protein YjbJ (UPF0337 family)